MRRAMLTLTAAAALLLAAGCGDDKSDNEVLDTGDQVVPRQEFREPRQHRVTIEGNDVSPEQLQIAAGVNQQLQVTNASDRPCRFTAPPYIVAVDIPPGETATVNLTTPDVARNTGLRSANVVTMGCEGDEQRQGSLVIEAQGPSTDPGAVTPNPSSDGVQPGPGVAGTQMAGPSPTPVR